MSAARWWEGRGFVAAMLLAAVLPLLWPTIPPLNDLPGHLGRYHIAATLDRSADLQRHWSYTWGLVGNLGVDLIAIPLARAIGAEAATRLVTILIPPLFVGGLLALARARGARIGPAAGFAVPLAYAYPFQLGFVNFMLAAALVFWALAGWIALARRPWVRALVFLPASWILWITHSFGWGLFGLAAFAADVALRRERDAPWPYALFAAAAACLALATPLAAMLGGAGSGGDLAWDWQSKAVWVAALLRDRWKWFDIASAFVVLALAWTALRHRDWRYDRVLGASAALALAAFVALPRLALGGAYVDMRMLAPALALALIAIRIDDPRTAARVAAAGAAFVAIRALAMTASFALYAEQHQRVLAAVPHLPRGAAVLVLVNEACASRWHSDRTGHLAGIAVARRDIFENGQWGIDGQQLLRPRHPGAEPYRSDPSQLVRPRHCEYRTTDLGEALRDFDRATFDHVWLIGFAPVPVAGRDLVRVHADAASTVYRVSAAKASSRLPEAPLPR